MNRTVAVTLLLLFSGAITAVWSQETAPAGVFEAKDVFQLEYASDPQISPDGRRVVYVRNSMDIMKDQRRSRLWIISADGHDHRPLTDGNRNESSPRWSGDGKRLLFLASDEAGSQLEMRWMDTGQTAQVTYLTHAPSGLAWSPNGERVAFSMLVPETAKPWVELPTKPEGAEWAESPKVIDKLIYRVDGSGYLEDGWRHLFVVPADGGTPRQLTSGRFHHSGTPAWSIDGKALYFSANRHEDAELDPRNSEIHRVSTSNGVISTLTDRAGPDSSPAVSPDGKYIAYTGFDDKFQGYQIDRLYVMARDGTERRILSGELDRSVDQVLWSSDSNRIYFTYSEEGNTCIGVVTLNGDLEVLVSDLGGTSIGRPYSGGSFSVSRDGTLAYTQTGPLHPADVAVRKKGGPSRRITRLNEDLFDYKKLGEVTELSFDSSFDGRTIQGWMVKPPAFDPAKKYPMILEIHGGPFANYGPRFAAEIQLYAAAGYVVLYTNPRGSTSYGEEFGNLIHHNYPGQDYDDLMSGVDAAIALGYVDENQLYVTGGSGGGVLSAWIVGKTDRFRAAVVAKPVINWYSFVLTSDMYNFFYKYWFPGFPWDHPDHYLKRSPVSLVGNVKTPTMLLTGEIDYRTPMSESEQFYQALRLRKIDTALVRIPGASHGIARRPSHLIAKVAYVLAWFERYRSTEE